MATFRAIRHDTTGYSPNFLVIGRKTKAPPDIVYRSPEKENDENYDRFVEQMRERFVTAYTNFASICSAVRKRTNGIMI